MFVGNGARREVRDRMYVNMATSGKTLEKTGIGISTQNGRLLPC